MLITCKIVSKPIDKIVSENTLFLEKKISDEVTQIKKKLPYINWNPKLYKNLYNHRTQVSSEINFKSCYNLKTQNYSGAKTFWSFQNNQTVIDTTNKISSRNNTISFSKFDFFTLHSNIRHCNLKSLMRDLITIHFNGGDKEFIEIAKYGAIWTKNQLRY